MFLKKAGTIFISLVLVFGVFGFFYPEEIYSQQSIAITNVSDNSTLYAGGSVPKFDKLEITFSIANSVADNFQLPYDSNPPANLGVSGITVDASFLPPGESNWDNAISQPAFYYQDFLQETRNNNTRDWLYPTSTFSWKVRYAPQQIGEWQYRLTAKDASGTTTTSSRAFSVSESGNKGFIRVSPTDRRYFEFDDGTYFPAFGYNMNFNHINWIYPLKQNQANFVSMGQNKVQLVRLWLSQWSIFGAGWNPWKGLYSQGGDPPATFLVSNVNQYSDDNNELSIKIGDQTDRCVFHDPYNNAPIAVKRATPYQIRIYYYPDSLIGLGGFAAKLGDHNGCATATPITPYVREGAQAEWQWLTGTFTTTANQDYLDNLYLHLENMTSGNVRVAEVEMREMVNGSPVGPNILQKPKMDQHTYFDQRNSYAFDLVVGLAKQNGVYLRPVVGDHREWTFTHIDHSGNPTADSSGSGFYFYGPGDTTVNKTRWLQRAWWRYLQARWGYSPNIHSWEYVNEGDPNYSGHRISANMMGEYFRQFTPHQMVSTSVWSGSTSTWNLNNYPGIDFADVHRYIGRDEAASQYYDAAEATLTISQNRGVPQTGGSWPIIRGETGFVTTQGNTNSVSDELRQDTDGIWLHNFLWAGLNSNGLIESYWYENYHVYDCPVAGSQQGCPLSFDHRSHYKPVVDFLTAIPLSRGGYLDAEAYGYDTNTLRVVGQKDALRNRAHLWIQNRNHTWKNVVDSAPLAPVSAAISIDGFGPNTTLKVEWWNTYTGEVERTDNISTDIAGTLDIQVSNLTTDLAVKIGDYDQVIPSPTIPTLQPGDANGDAKVDGLDYVIWLTNYGDSNPNGPNSGDFNSDDAVDGIDYVIWLTNYNST